MVAAKKVIFLDTNIFVIDRITTWDAEHFSGKSTIPVLTPKDYLRQLNEQRG